MKQITIFIMMLIIVLCLGIISIVVYIKYIDPYRNIKVRTLDELNDWVHTNIKYKTDIYDNWQLPEKTMKLKTGDCEDKAILFRDIAKKKFQIHGELVLIAVRQDIRLGHVIVIYNNRVYDPTMGVNMTIFEYFYKYDVVLVEFCIDKKIQEKINATKN